MKARQLINGASFGPDKLKAVTQAFEEAWGLIAGNYGGPLAIEAARLKLANAVLEVAAREKTCDVELLKRLSLEAMAAGK